MRAAASPTYMALIDFLNKETSAGEDIFQDDMRFRIETRTSDLQRDMATEICMSAGTRESLRT